MKLSKFSYRENDWILDEIEFKDINLIVGKNAAGKSRTLRSMADVFMFMNNKINMQNRSFECSLEFQSNKKYHYSFNLKEGKVVYEQLIVDEHHTLISRDGHGSFLKGEGINPPEDVLILQSRRDTEAFPEFEEILNWTEHSTGFMFSNASASNTRESDNFLFKGNLNFESFFEKLSKSQVNEIIEKLKSMDYNVSTIENVDLPNEFKIVFLYEEGIHRPLFTMTISNGMYRVIYLLFYIYYVANYQKASCLMIDDLGEGLDYSRSTKLTSILYDYCSEHGIQVIATSNDSFLLNQTKLDYWTVLSRIGSHVKNYSESNHPKLFRKFKFTGLNNFALLSSDFIDRFLQEEGNDK